jgi:hypothetical protein
MELSLREVVDIPIPERRGVETTQSQQPNMVKSFVTLAVVALLGAAVIALPGLAPAVQANEAAVLAKGDRLAVRAPSSCSTQVWPDFTASCLRNNRSGAILEARLVTARR